MSSNYKLGVGFYGYDYGLQRKFNEAAYGAANFERAMGRGQRQMGLWDQQMRAFGTTMRYALAGGLVFSAVKGISALSDFQNKLGEIDSLAARLDSRGNLVGLGSNLDRVGDFVLRTSAKFAQAVPDVEQFMTRFYSSFDPPAGAAGIKQAQDFVDTMAQLRLALGSEAGDPFELAGGVAGFMQGIPGMDVKRDSQRVADIIAEVTRVSPIITGRDISRDIGRLGAAQTALNFTPEEIFAVYGLASKRGGSPALVGRGVSQLLQTTLLEPQTKDQKKAFLEMGLPDNPEGLRSMGGAAILKKIFDFVGPVSVTNARALGDESVDTAAALDASGANGRPGALNTLSEAIGRSESFRVLLTLLSLPGGANNAIKDFTDGLKEAEKTHRSEQRARIQLNQMNITQAGTAAAALRVQAMRNLDVAIKPITWGLTKVSQQALAHPNATKAAEGAFIASLLGVGLGKLFPNKVGGPLSSVIPGYGKLVGNPAAKLIAAEQAANIFNPASLAPDGSMQRPFWVVIAPVSRYVNEPETSATGGTQGGTGSTGTTGGKKGRKPPLGAVKKYGVPGAILGTGALFADDLNRQLPGYEEDRSQKGKIDLSPGPGDKAILNWVKKQLKPEKKWSGRWNTYPQTSAWVNNQFGKVGESDQFGKIWENMNRTDRMGSLSQTPILGDVLASGGSGEGGGGAEGKVTLRLELSPDAKRVLKAVDETIHVPVKVWGGKAPSHRGKPTTTRSGPR